MTNHDELVVPEKGGSNSMIDARNALRIIRCARPAGWLHSSTTEHRIKFVVLISARHAIFPISNRWFQHGSEQHKPVGSTTTSCRGCFSFVVFRARNDEGVCVQPKLEFFEFVAGPLIWQ
jgi:hypothetical protein